MSVQDLVHQLANANPLVVTAWATIVLAFIAGISILTNIALARSASWSAAAAENATSLQQSELDVIKRQLTLSEDQFKAAQQVTIPRLKVIVTNADPSIVSGHVLHYHGSEPAVDVDIWIRTVSMAGAAWVWCAQISSAARDGYQLGVDLDRIAWQPTGGLQSRT